MATLFRMPGVSADADEAVLEAWTITQGATISSGQAIASVETEKAVVEVESDVDAVVHALLVTNGATVPVGDPIAVLLEIDEDPAEGEKLLAQLGLGTAAAAETQNAIASAPEEAQAPPASAAGAQVDTIAPAGPTGTNGAAPADRNGGRVFASPIARKLAREKGIDFATLTGTGPGGRIVRDDVLAAAAQAPAPAPAAAPTTAPAAAAPAAPAPAAAAPVVRPGWEATPHSRLRKLVASRCRRPSSRLPTSTCGCRCGWTSCSPSGPSSTPRPANGSRSTTSSSRPRPRR